MATSTVSSAGPRYAPADPTLPKPWRGLVDGKTGYLYFWNPETNVTQYERPKAPTPPTQSVSAPLEKPFTPPLSASVQVQQSSQGQPRDSNCSDDGDRNSRASNGASQLASGTRSYQVNVELTFANFCPCLMFTMKVDCRMLFTIDF